MVPNHTVSHFLNHEVSSIDLRLPVWIILCLNLYPRKINLANIYKQQFSLTYKVATFIYLTFKRFRWHFKPFSPNVSFQYSLTDFSGKDFWCKDFLKYHVYDLNDKFGKCKRLSSTRKIEEILYLNLQSLT